MNQPAEDKLGNQIVIGTDSITLSSERDGGQRLLTDIASNKLENSNVAIDLLHGWCIFYVALHIWVVVAAQKLNFALKIILVDALFRFSFVRKLSNMFTFTVQQAKEVSVILRRRSTRKLRIFASWEKVDENNKIEESRTHDLSCFERLNLVILEYVRISTTPITRSELKFAAFKVVRKFGKNYTSGNGRATATEGKSRGKVCRYKPWTAFVALPQFLARHQLTFFMQEPSISKL